MEVACHPRRSGVKEVAGHHHTCDWSQRWAYVPGFTLPNSCVPCILGMQTF